MPGTALRPTQIKTAASEVIEPLEHEIAVAMGLWVPMLVDKLKHPDCLHRST